MRGMFSALFSATLVVMAFGLATSAASAQSTSPSFFRRAPGPILGAGLPALLLIGGGYWAVRRFRRKAD
jgi:flagellar biogenesis protein FliO